MRNLMVAASALIMLAGGAAIAGPRDRQAAAAARVTPIPGAKAESCIPLTQIRESRVRGDGLIDFYMRGGKIYRNALPYSCPQLGFEEAFTYSTSLNQLCSQDIITVIPRGGRGIRGASCGLGQFQPATETKKPRG